MSRTLLLTSLVQRSLFRLLKRNRTRSSILNPILNPILDVNDSERKTVLLRTHFKLQSQEIPTTSKLFCAWLSRKQTCDEVLNVVRSQFSAQMAQMGYDVSNENMNWQT